MVDDGVGGVDGWWSNGESDKTGDGGSRVDFIWRSCLRRLESELPSEEFNAHLRTLHPRPAEGRLELLAPNQYVRERVERDYLLRIAELVSELDDRGILDGVDLVVGSRERQPGMPLAAPRRAEIRHDRQVRLGEEQPTQGLNPAYAFETFIEGRSNEFAKAAAMQAADKPGRSYNPLLLYGGVGLGKTHLLQAVGNELKRRNRSARVIYLNSQGFTDEMVRGIQTSTISATMARFGSADALLIDDIQFFAGKEKTQEEFFHVFNAISAHHGQIVVTCDRYPREIDGLEERLQSRFVGGLTVEVVPPELETRVAILQKKAEAEGIDLPSEVAFQIAERVRSSVRELEGALARIISRARITKADVTMELMHRALSDLFAVQVRRITIAKIQSVVAEYYNIKQSDMVSPRRTRAIARPRQIAMALARELTNHSLPEIGDRFGGRDHATVLYACKKVEQLRETNPDIAEDYKNLSRLLIN